MVRVGPSWWDGKEIIYKEVSREDLGDRDGLEIDPVLNRDTGGKKEKRVSTDRVGINRETGRYQGRFQSVSFNQSPRKVWIGPKANSVHLIGNADLGSEEGLK